jgi:hypothetical protein
MVGELDPLTGRVGCAAAAGLETACEYPTFPRYE